MSTSTLTHLIATYGYLAVFLGVGIESMGVPFPGETTLILASIYAGSTHQLLIPWVIAAAALGAIIGDNLGYLIGREGGFRLVRRFGHVVHLSERKLKVGQYIFLRHGGKMVFFGRFVTILRTWVAFLAGVNRMPWPRFLMFNALGAMVWATGYGIGGYILGRNIYRFSGIVGIAIGVVAVLVIIALFILLRRNEHRLEEEAEQALPGPIYGRENGGTSPGSAPSSGKGAPPAPPERPSDASAPPMATHQSLPGRPSTSSATSPPRRQSADGNSRRRHNRADQQARPAFGPADTSSATTRGIPRPGGDRWRRQPAENRGATSRRNPRHVDSVVTGWAGGPGRRGIEMPAYGNGRKKVPWLSASGSAGNRTILALRVWHCEHCKRQTRSTRMRKRSR